MRPFSLGPAVPKLLGFLAIFLLPRGVEAFAGSIGGDSDRRFGTKKLREVQVGGLAG